MTLRAGQHDLHGFTLVVQQLGSPREPDFLLTVRGPSVRRLTGPRGSPGLCTVPPGPEDPCELVSVDDVMWQLIERTRAREGHVDVRHDEAIVHEWAHVDRAALAIADTLRAWRIATPYLLRVRRPTCVEELTGP